MKLTTPPYRTVQSEIFAPEEPQEMEVGADRNHGKFIAIVVVLVVTAASLATLFAAVS